MIKLPRPQATGGQPGRMALKRTVVGTAAALATMAVLTGAMLPIRASLSTATTALILIVPVVIGVVVGGFPAGVLSVVAGFLVYDFFFIRPYLTLWVGAPQNWAALGVYVVVMVPVAMVVAGMNTARAKERRQGTELRELFAVSGLLLEDKPLEELLSVIVTTLADVFGARQVALLLPLAGRLEVAATAGDPLSAEQLRQVMPPPGALGSVGEQTGQRDDLLLLALTASGRPIGLLALSGLAAGHSEREPLLLFANQIALAVERAQLREQALRTRLTEEMARLARTLVAAVAHDLRAPLSSIKASSSTLSDPDLGLTADARQSLAKLIDVQADRLAELVANLLDMSRIQAGVLEPRRSLTQVADLVSGVSVDLGSALRGHVLTTRIADGLPPVDVDITLISRVLSNLVHNAIRHSPKDAPITISAEPAAGPAAGPAAEPTAGPAQPETVLVSVTDQGAGISPSQRDEIFTLFVRRADDAGAGLGLTIAKTFIEAHGQRIWVEDAPGGGARFCFTLPAAANITEERELAEDSHHR
jgi:two-component system, OmpR family, sensor histidine kinase KdpD